MQPGHILSPAFSLNRSIFELWAAACFVERIVRDFRISRNEAKFAKATKAITGIGIFQFIISVLFQPLINKLINDGNFGLIDLVTLIVVVLLLFLTINLFIVDLRFQYYKFKLSR